MTPDPKVKTRTRTAEQKKADAASQRARRAAAKLAAPPAARDESCYDEQGDGVDERSPAADGVTAPVTALRRDTASDAATLGTPPAGRQRIDAAFEERFRALHAEGKTMRQMQEALGYKGTLYSLHRRFGLAPNRAPKA